MPKIMQNCVAGNSYLPANILSFEAKGTSIISLFQSTSRICISSLDTIKGIKDTNFFVAICKLMTCKKKLIEYSLQASWCPQARN